MTIPLPPMPNDSAPAREWALYLAAAAEARGNFHLGNLWREVAATL
jgi:hypothetical protein